jgi:hypothetical protein
LKVSRRPAGADTCIALESLPFYTSTGLISTGLFAYIDPYGTFPILGYESFIDLSGQAWEIDAFTGQIGFASGYFC